MAGRDRDELGKTAGEALAILGPEQIVEKHPHGVEADLPSHAQLAIDAAGLIGARLKHLELIDGVRGDVVRADEPTLRLIPGVGAIDRPPAGIGRGDRHSRQRRACCQNQG